MQSVAWSVIGPGEIQSIAFHPVALFARQQVARAWSVPASRLTVSRAQEFDQYADSKEVPAAALFFAGIVVPCACCDTPVSARNVTVEPIIEGGRVFCGRACQMFDAAYALRSAESLQLFKHQAESALSHIPVTITECLLDDEEVPYALFTFQGAIHGGKLHPLYRDGEPFKSGDPIQLKITQEDYLALGLLDPKRPSDDS